MQRLFLASWSSAQYGQRRRGLAENLGRAEHSQGRCCEIKPNRLLIVGAKCRTEVRADSYSFPMAVFQRDVYRVQCTDNMACIAPLFLPLVTNRIVIINTKEIVNSPMNGPVLPYTPGGDHVGVIWFDAHGDMNTPDVALRKHSRDAVCRDSRS
jgi:hypothetical protein